MANDITADGAECGADMVGRLTQVSSRTSLMVIDSTLRALPKDGAGHAAAHAEIRSLARRMLHATQDFSATLESRFGPG